jgi:hypothetical protein
MGSMLPYHVGSSPGAFASGIKISGGGRVRAAKPYHPPEDADEPPDQYHLWQQLTQDVTTEMRAWRLAHPKATPRAIEVELDARLNQMRARMIEDLALAGSAADWSATPAVEVPRCSACDHPLEDRGAKSRTLQTHGGQALTIGVRRQQPRRSDNACLDPTSPGGHGGVGEATVPHVL